MTGNDDGTEACQIDVLIEEHEERTRAKARLSWAGKKFVGVGVGTSICLSLARVMGPPFCHEHGTGYFRLLAVG
jgi:hypothetical protein